MYGRITDISQRDKPVPRKKRESYNFSSSTHKASADGIPSKNNVFGSNVNNISPSNDYCGTNVVKDQRTHHRNNLSKPRYSRDCLLCGNGVTHSLVVCDKFKCMSSIERYTTVYKNMTISGISSSHAPASLSWLLAVFSFVVLLEFPGSRGMEGIHYTSSHGSYAKGTIRINQAQFW